MPLGFPSSPASGQLATVNNRNYQYDGFAWGLVSYTIPNASTSSAGTVQVIDGGGITVSASGALASVGSQLYLWSNFR